MIFFILFLGRIACLRNVFAELKGKELRYSCDPYCSRVIEKLFKTASSQQLRSFLSALLPQYVKLL